MPTFDAFGNEIITQSTGAKGLVKTSNSTALEVRLLNYENNFDKKNKETLKNFISLKSLNQDDGYIVFTIDNSGLHMDASNCRAIVKLNGYVTSKAQCLTANDLIKIGSDIWRIKKIPLLGNWLLKIIAHNANHTMADGVILANEFKKISGKKCIVYR